jgi:hypothetical protein
MTEQELQEIEQRAAAATPGPWRKGIGNSSREVCSQWPAPCHLIVEGYNSDDLKFCAHAREDIPALVAEVRRLRAALEEIREKAGLVPDKYMPYPEQVNFYDVVVLEAIEAIIARALEGEK